MPKHTKKVAAGGSGEKRKPKKRVASGATPKPARKRTRTA